MQEQEIAARSRADRRRTGEADAGCFMIVCDFMGLDAVAWITCEFFFEGAHGVRRTPGSKASPSGVLQMNPCLTRPAAALDSSEP